MSLDYSAAHAGAIGADERSSRPAPGKVTRTERLPSHRGAAPSADVAPVQADGGMRVIDDPFALHLGQGSSPALVVQRDGGVGAAGDVYEGHAEAVAAAVVRGESAEALLDAGATGAPAVQRDEMTATERRTALADSDRTHGVELEQIAHRIAYQDELTPLDRTGLAGLGLDPARAQFHPGRGDLQFWTFPRATTGTAHFAPVIAFRGTASSDDVAEDATGSGIGLAQFTMNQALITHALHALGGGVIATGHSLGGALAQIAGCYFPDQIASVVTFQAPGIASEVLDRIRHRDADHRPAAHHYRVDGCIVDDAGAEFIPGGVTVFGHDENPAHAHTTFPLLAERGDERGDWIGPTDPPEGLLATVAMGARVDPEVGATRHETSTDASPIDQSRTLSTAGTADTVRDEVGRRVLGDADRRDRYARLWIDEVVPAAQAVTEVPIDDFILRRCREQEIPDDASAMLSNYRGLFPELAAADAEYRMLGGSETPSEDAFVDRVLTRAGAIDDAGRERVRRYWANLPTGRGAATMGGSGHRDRSDIDRDHAAGRAALERITAPHAEHDPAERAPTPRPRERAPRHHDRHSMVAPDRGVISDAPAETVHAHAARGVSGSGGVLPHLAAIQRSFGHHDVSGVRAHVGGAAAEAAQAIGAAAYATGDAVAFAGAPDLRQAAHEAAHVVQQRGGVRLDGGVGRAGDPYERHADDVAALVTRGESAEALLDTMAHRGASGGPAVQREVMVDMNGSLLERHLVSLASSPMEFGAQLAAIERAARGRHDAADVVEVPLIGTDDRARAPYVAVRDLAERIRRASATSPAHDDHAAESDTHDASHATHDASHATHDATHGSTHDAARRSRPVLEGGARVTRERELIQAPFPVPFGVLEVTATAKSSAVVAPPEAESAVGHPPPGRVTVGTVEETDGEGATHRHLSVEGEGILRRMLDHDLGGITDHFEISPEHDGVHFSAGVNMPEAQIGPIRLRFAIDLVDYDPGARGRDALTILSPSATARVPLSASIKTAIGLDVASEAEIEVEAQYYPQRAQLLAALEEMFPAFFGAAEAGAAGAAEAAVAETTTAEAVEGGAAVAEGGFLGTLATIGAVILGFGALFATDGSTAAGERMAQQIAIYEYGLEFADVVTATVSGAHDATPSDAVREARARGRADAARLTAAQRRQLRAAGDHRAIALAASQVQAERQGTTFEATWFDRGR